MIFTYLSLIYNLINKPRTILLETNLYRAINVCYNINKECYEEYLDFRQKKRDKRPNIEPGNASNEKLLILTDWLAEFISGLMFPRTRSAFVRNSVWEVTKT